MRAESDGIRTRFSVQTRSSVLCSDFRSVTNSTLTPTPASLMTDTNPKADTSAASSHTTETSSDAPNLGKISDSIAGWIEQALTPLGFFFRTPWQMRFESAVQGEAGVVWAHATTSEGVNYELSPWMRMQFPTSAPLPKEIRAAQTARKQRLLNSNSPSSSSAAASGSLLNATHFTSHSFTIDSLLSVLGEEEVDGLVSTEATPVPHLFSCNILLGGCIPIDRHELGLDAVWKERIDAPSDSDLAGSQVAPTVAGFEERSQSILQRVWIHKRSVIHVDARAVTLASPSDAPSAVSYTRVVDELEITPRKIFFLLFPLLYCAIYLTFIWRHYRLRRKFGAHAGPILPPRTLGLKTKALDDFAVLAAARQDEEEGHAPFIPVLRDSTLGAAAGQSDEDFELVQSPAEHSSDTRKDK